MQQKTSTQFNKSLQKTTVAATFILYETLTKATFKRLLLTVIVVVKLCLG